MVYTTYTDINLMTNLTTVDVANADVTSIISEATKELNALINVNVVREPVLYIDVTRLNQLNGSNTTFYIKNWKDRFFADDNDDGTVTTADLTVYYVGSDGTETLPTISSIDTTKGSFTLSSAPSPGRLYVTYSWCLRNPYTPDPLIKLACTLLTAAYCYAKINFGRAPQVAFGNTKIYRHIEAFDLYYKRFMKVVSQINNQMPDNRLSEEGI
jgi:hypothetical protein